MSSLSPRQLWVVASATPDFDVIYDDQEEAIAVAEKASASVFASVSIKYRALTLDDAIDEATEAAREFFKGSYRD